MTDREYVEQARFHAMNKRAEGDYDKADLFHRLADLAELAIGFMEAKEEIFDLAEHDAFGDYQFGRKDGFFKAYEILDKVKVRKPDV